MRRRVKKKVNRIEPIERHVHIYQGIKVKLPMYISIKKQYIHDSRLTNMMTSRISIKKHT